MAITQTLCTSFKKELLEGEHDFTADVFKIALYTSAASLDASTTAYSVSNEASGTGYTAGGNTLTATGPTISSTTAYVDFADTTWSSATLTARGALIYNSSKANRAVAVIDFGEDKSVAAGNFTVQFPTYDLNNAIVRIV